MYLVNCTSKLFWAFHLHNTTQQTNSMKVMRKKDKVTNDKTTTIIAMIHEYFKKLSSFAFAFLSGGEYFHFFVDSSGRLVVNGLIKINNIENGELNLVVDIIKNTQ